ncbi:MAG: hypothetical protein JXD22_14770 [Sedimentisphaerales bacterium]|nr:hypothetical protein [Sedimentisphaerales bacterium]
MKMKIVVGIPMLLIAGLLVLPVFSQGRVAGKVYQESDYNDLEKLGNAFAPDACGRVKHNTQGSSLEFTLYGHKLVPQKEYVIAYGDAVLGKAVAESDGFLMISAKITDTKLLKQIAADSQRKFFIMQSNKKLARSACCFNFTYKAGK